MGSNRWEAGHPSVERKIDRSPHTCAGGFLLLAVLVPAVCGPATAQPRADPPNEQVVESDTAIAIGEGEALEARLRAAIQLSPSVASFHVGLGEALRAQGRMEEARAAFAEAVRLEPSNADLRLDLGIAHLALGEVGEAAANFEWAIRLEPARPELHAGLGEAFQQMQRPADAAEAFERASRLDPGNEEFAALAREARAAAGQDRAGPGEGPPLPRAIVQALTLGGAVILSLAALALVLPVLGAFLLLFVIVPLSLIRREFR